MRNAVLTGVLVLTTFGLGPSAFACKPTKVDAMTGLSVHQEKARVGLKGPGGWTTTLEMEQRGDKRFVRLPTIHNGADRTTYDAGTAVMLAFGNGEKLNLALSTAAVGVVNANQGAVWTKWMFEVEIPADKWSLLSAQPFIGWIVDPDGQAVRTDLRNPDAVHKAAICLN